jgi:NADPH2:quinone reductase
MKALVLDQPGTEVHRLSKDEIERRVPDRLHIMEISKPEPAAGEVRVRVHAAGLNPVDYKIARSGHPNWQYPFVLGLDVAGTIDAIGPGVEGCEVGDRVFYHGDLSRPGGYAEYATAVAHVVARIPEEVSFVEAAALPTSGSTAYQSLFRKLHLQAGQSVLVLGGAGGVGGFAVQLAAWAGATVIATTAAYNFDYVKKLGADHVIDDEENLQDNIENVKERVLSLTGGRGVDAIVDTVGGDSITAAMDMIAFNGGFAAVAKLPELLPIQPLAKAMSIHEIFLNGVYRVNDRIGQEDLARMGREMIELVRTRQIDAAVSEVISLEAVPDGLRRLKEFHGRGKIVAQLVGC